MILDLRKGEIHFFLHQQPAVFQAAFGIGARVDFEIIFASPERQPGSSPASRRQTLEVRQKVLTENIDSTGMVGDNEPPAFDFPPEQRKMPAQITFFGAEQFPFAHYKS
jgi:hypothetical protein